MSKYETHQWAKLHYQQVGSDLSALGQALQQSMMLESTEGQRKEMCQYHNVRKDF